MMKKSNNLIYYYFLILGYGEENLDLLYFL